MTEPQENKEFIDPATASAVGAFAIRSIAQAIIGWIGLEFFRKSLKKLKDWFKKHDKHTGSISEKES